MSSTNRPWPEPVILENEAVRLVPLEPAHAGPLAEAVSDGRLWELWYTTIPRPDDVLAEIERRLNLRRLGSMLPFTVIDRRSGRIVGQTTFMNVDAQNLRVEIGSTWYAASGAANSGEYRKQIAALNARVRAAAVHCR